MANPVTPDGTDSADVLDGTYEQAVRFPDVHVQLSDEDGNVFYIIGRVTKALRRAGYGPEAEAFATEAMGKSSYDAVLQLVMRTVETA